MTSKLGKTYYFIHLLPYTIRKSAFLIRKLSLEERLVVIYENHCPNSQAKVYDTGLILSSSCLTFAENENVESKVIATYVLQLTFNQIRDGKTSDICKSWIGEGTFGKIPSFMSLPICFLLDLLEIGKRRYNALRDLCISENIIISSYDKVSSYRRGGSRIFLGVVHGASETSDCKGGLGRTPP